MGVSMGGSGTIRFALHHPELWSSATIISGPVLDTQQMIEVARNPLFVPIIPMDRIWGPLDDRARIRADDPFVRWRRPEDLGDMRLMVAWGNGDRGPIVDTSRRFHRHLEQNEVPHEAFEFDGNHSWRSWKPVIEEALRRMVPPSRWARGPGRG
jgi:S-formylglutathione hydrolase FrmB